MFEIKSQDDIDEILSYMNRVVGYYCVEAVMSLGTELWLAFEQNKQVLNHSIHSKIAGEWSIATSITDWKIVQSDQILVTSNESYKDLEQKVLQLVGLKLIDLDIEYPRLKLTLNFENSKSLIVKPSVEEFYDYTVSFWDVYLPHNMMLEVGPDYFWDIQESDFPS